MIPFRSDPAHIGYQASPRERAGAFVFAIVASALIFLVMWKMGAVAGFGDGRAQQLTAIDLSREGQDEKQAEKQLPKQEKKQAKAATAPPSAPVMAPPPVPIPGKVAWPEGFIELSRDDYKATDVSRMKRQESGGGAQASAGGSPGDSASVGQGPGGVRLYAAQWYREPTDAEIGPYLPPRRMQGDWAMIACKTVEKYHVEDCQELGESPPGSGLARALRQASWQFLVRPPRVNGKPQVGEWVRIRFDFRPKKGGAEQEG